MKKFLIILALLLTLVSFTAQTQSQACNDAINTAYNQLQGAKTLLQSGNAQGALVLIQSAEDMLAPCRTESTQTGSGSTTDGSTELLRGGIGLTTGQPITDGAFEVEGYCSYLNGNYATTTDGVNWYCTLDGSIAVTLTQANFDEICRLTYNNPNAFAVQSSSSNTPAYNWLCYERIIEIPPTPPPGSVLQPQLLQNGIGLTTSQIVNNGVFEVEGYCRYLNRDYGVDTDGVNWYCTLNGQNVVTLTQANFDEICRLTYDNGGAFAVLSAVSDTQAYNWRCYQNVVVALPTPEPTTVVLVPQLLQNGIGLTNSQPVNNGEFQVEGYCAYLNSSYITETDSVDWYCTVNGRTAVNLIKADFDRICRLTYNNSAAYAMRSATSDTPAYNWRCYENVPVTSATRQTQEQTQTNYQLRITWFGEDSLFVTNSGSVAFPPGSLTLRNRQGELQGREWGVNELLNGECVAVWKDTGNPRAADETCSRKGADIRRDGPNRFWKSPFTVFYNGVEYGTCSATPCNVTIQP